jgi:hypothetical protein
MRAGLIVRAFCAPLLLALCASQTWAAPCVTPPLDEKAIADFKANPQAVIAPESDSRTIEAAVRDLAGTDPKLAEDLVHLAGQTTPRFQNAIAAGLAQAAIACTTADQQAALLIQQAAAAFDNSEFQTTFAAVSGDLSTAAAEIAQASATASVGSVTILNQNGGGPVSTRGGGGGGIALVQITSGAVASAARTAGPTITTTAATQVSATR